ncbi:hypothetical protein [Paracoccus rhizosphaerae]|uniref:Uncharacterized protein n=1 Tax=Paracoccus rhizosphaerae TaxID=1133347 RepID=A0ABV6CJQ1_9RHOB|nr:hypothetical protein [Paracoccus rhizosphaerae]
MFDYLPTEIHHEPLSLAQRLFFNHGHDLAEAAAQLGGACGKARVVSCGLQIEAATRMTFRIRRELAAIHRLLALENVGNLALLHEAFLGYTLHVQRHS